MFKLFDSDRDGIIEREEWMARSASGVRLPDFGVSEFILWRLGGRNGAGILDRIRIYGDTSRRLGAGGRLSTPDSH